MTTVQILEGALDTLRRKGWHQRHYFSMSGAVCLAGAIVQAQGVDLSARDGEIARAERCDAAELVKRLIGVELIHIWNDAEQRTFADIEAVLTAAIAIAQQQDQPAPAVEVTA